MIDPAEIPTLDGVKAGQIAAGAAAVRSAGKKVGEAGGAVHTTWQGLSGSYKAPEADRLLSAMVPVKTDAAAFGGRSAKVAAACAEFGTAAGAIKKRLLGLKAEAEAFVKRMKALGEEWRADPANVAEDARLQAAVTAAVQDFMDAEEVCAGKVRAAYGGGVVADRGKLPFGTESDWGTPETVDEPWYADMAGGVQGFVAGLVVDGLVGDVVGLGTLVGVNGGDQAGKAWQGLLDLGILFSGGSLAISNATQAAARGDRDAQRRLATMEAFGKGMTAWDQWEKDPGRALGAVTYNVVTLPIAATKFGTLGKLGKAGAAIDAATSAAARAGRIVDPLNQAINLGVKGGNAAIKGLGKINLGKMPDMGDVAKAPDPADARVPDASDVGNAAVEPVTDAGRQPEPSQAAEHRDADQPATRDPSSAETGPVEPVRNAEGRPLPTTQDVVNNIGRAYEDDFLRVDKADPDQMGSPSELGERQPTGIRARPESTTANRGIGDLGDPIRRSEAYDAGRIGDLPSILDGTGRLYGDAINPSSRQGTHAPRSDDLTKGLGGSDPARQTPVDPGTFRPGDGHPGIRDGQGKLFGTTTPERLDGPQHPRSPDEALKDGGKPSAGDHDGYGESGLDDPPLRWLRELDDQVADAGEAITPMERADRPHIAIQPQMAEDYYSNIPLTVEERYFVRNPAKPVPLFDGIPTREQTAQGRVGDCGIVATLGAVAGHRPGVIQDAIRQTGDGTYEIRLHQVDEATPANPVARPTGDTVTYKMNDKIPVALDDVRRPPVGMKAETCGWPALLEKAAASQDQIWNPKQKAEWDRTWRWSHKADVDRDRAAHGLGPSPYIAPTGYNRLDIGSTAHQRANLLAELTGKEAEVREIPNEQQGGQALLDEFRDQLADGKPILVGTRGQFANEGNPYPGQGVFEFGHAYEVTKIENGKIHLRNPWGPDDMGYSTDPPPMDVKTFWEYYRQYGQNGMRLGSYSTLR